MAEFDYKQRPATQAYRDNWERIYAVSPSPIHSPEPLAGSGEPASMVGPSGLCTLEYVSSTCPWCHGAGCDLTPETVAMSAGCL